MLLTLILAAGLSHADLHVLEETTVDTITRAADGYPELRARRHFRTESEARDYWRELPQDLAPLARRTLDNPEGSSLWTVREAWSWDWEIKLAEWIRTEVDADFFVRHKVATDCADVAYALRWIFARENGLPMRSRLGSGEWFTENSVRPKWEALPSGGRWFEDKRFLAALDYVLNLTYTHTLRDDSYPVEITPAAILEGGIHLTLHNDSGHTRPIMRVARPGEPGLPLQILQSTVPRAIRKLMSDGYWQTENTPVGEGGLLRFRWPNPNGEGLIAAESMPHYSLEQYDAGFLNEGEVFFLAVYRRIAPGFKLEDLVNGMITTARDTLTQRQQIVRDGYAYCQANDCAPGTAGFEAWSTPTRDARVSDQLRDLQQLLWRLPNDLQRQVQKTLDEPFLTEGEATFSLKVLSWAFNRHLPDPDPRLAPEERWRLTPVAVATYLARRDLALWIEREAFLERTSDCPATVCLDGSDAYKARASRRLDRDLGELAAIAREYASNVTQPMAAAFAREFENLNLGERLPRYLRLNSDPRHSARVRRDGLVEPAVVTAGWGQMKSNRDFLVVSSAGDMKIHDLRGPKPRVIDFNPVDVNLERGTAFAREGQLLRRLSLADGRVATITLDFEPSVVRATSAGGAFALSADHFAVLDADLRVSLEGGLTAFSYPNAEFFLMETEGHVERVSAQADRAVIALPSANELTTFETRMGWFISTKGKLYLLRRADLGLQTISDASDAFLVAADGRQVVVQHGSSFARYDLDERGAVSNRVAIPGASFQWSGTGSYLTYAEGGVKVSCFARETLRCLRALPGEDAVTDARGDYVTAKKGDQILFRRGTEVVYQLKAMFAGLPKDALGFAQICDGFDEETDWQSACRVIDLDHPERYSVLTGLAAIPVFSEEAWTLKRGVSVFIGGSTVWFDTLR